jgi:hypothetical protein
MACLLQDAIMPTIKVRKQANGITRYTVVREQQGAQTGAYTSRLFERGCQIHEVAQFTRHSPERASSIRQA